MDSGNGLKDQSLESLLGGYIVFISCLLKRLIDPDSELVPFCSIPCLRRGFHNGLEFTL